MGRINSIRCRHTCLMYVHIIHGCDATFLCGFPPRTVSRDGLLLIYQSVYELPTRPNSAQTRMRVGFPGCMYMYREMNILSPVRPNRIEHAA